MSALSGSPNKDQEKSPLLLPGLELPTSSEKQTFLAVPVALSSTGSATRELSLGMDDGNM
jgi:hypothetical protein